MYCGCCIFHTMNKDGATGPLTVILAFLTSIWLNAISQSSWHTMCYFLSTTNQDRYKINCDGDLLLTTSTTPVSAQNPLFLDDPSRPLFLTLLAKTALFVPTWSFYTINNPLRFWSPPPPSRVSSPQCPERGSQLSRSPTAHPFFPHIRTHSAQQY